MFKKRYMEKPLVQTRAIDQVRGMRNAPKRLKSGDQPIVLQRPLLR
jgi:hypothetical protein